MTLDAINKPGGDMAALTNLSFRVTNLALICAKGRAAPQEEISRAAA